jgi:nucleoside-diphosphate-sugar epimerase
MRVLVTGSRGYIGCHVVEALKSEGNFVKGVDLDLFAGCDLSDLPEPHEFLQQDVLDLTPDDFEGFDAVIHLAALSNDPVSELSPAHTWRINFEGSMHVARCAKAAGVSRFIFSSSCSIYGATGDEALGETARTQPITVYGETKIASEQGIGEMADDQFSPTFLRNATAYGSSPRLRLDVVLNNLAAWAFTTGEIRIISDGTPWRPLVHTKDIARGMVYLLTVDRSLVHNEVFNFGRTKENYRVREVAEAVLDAVPGSSVVYTGEGSPDARDYSVDFSKFAQRFPAFDFEHDLRSGAKDLLEAYASYGLTKEDVEGAKFIRLKTLKARGQLIGVNSIAPSD